MADALRNALDRKLAAYEAAGMTEAAARVRDRIAELEEEPAPLESLTKAELAALAEQRGIEVGNSLTKSDLVEALEEAE